MRKKLLIVYDYFTPAYKAGGPIRSLQNLTTLFGDHHDCYVYTGNTDLDGNALDVVSDQWTTFSEGVNVFYSSKEKRSKVAFNQQLEQLRPDAIYLNGTFSMDFVLLPLRSLQDYQGDYRLVFAPRGMLQKQPMAQKSLKKRLYLLWLKKCIKPLSIHWQLTTVQEQEESSHWVDCLGDTVLSNVPFFTPNGKSREKTEGVFRLTTLALIHPIKNLHLVLEALLQIKQSVNYTIYGPIKNQEYWGKCQQIIDRMPSHIAVSYQGAVEASRMPEVMAQNDFYIQPSQSENFGHSLFEAFNAGLPVITSDQTPWRKLEAKKAGWDVDLKEEGSLKQALEKALSFDKSTYAEWSMGARKLAEDFMSEQDFVASYEDLFFN